MKLNTTGYQAVMSAFHSRVNLGPIRAMLAEALDDLAREDCCRGPESTCTCGGGGIMQYSETYPLYSDGSGGRMVDLADPALVL